MKTKLLVLGLVASVAANAAFGVAVLVTSYRSATLPMERLGLDAAQRSKLSAEGRQFTTERTRAHARMTKLRDALAAELAGDHPDQKQMLEISEEMAGIQAEMRPKLVTHLVMLHSLLRPDQRGALSAMLRGGSAPGCPGAVLGEPGPSADPAGRAP
jgi:hypothetical protein